ncbi:hypothetical protein [Parasphingorhabdus sp.]|uniref:hypothetical protein n=1 Tax=Parasphingorhabdus sp. TaxID=2709688 RepID=UPI00326770E5
MKMTKLLAASSAVVALALGAPAMAQQAQDNDNNTTGAAGDNSDTIVVNDLLDVYLQAQNNSQDNDTLTVGDVNSNNTANTITATQLLLAVNTNSNMEEVVDMNTDDNGDNNHNSGDNYVRGSAFAAYAGILDQSFSSGTNSNAQSASNIAAQGTITF